MSDNLNIVSLFQAVTSTLEENKSDLNKADEYNGDHGDNMVNIFSLATQAMSEKEGSGLSEQLASASKILSKQDSGSAQEYAKGFATAAEEFQGGELSVDSVLPLLQAMFGGGEKPQQDSSVQGLLGGLLGGDDDKLDIGDLLSAGMSFMSAKNEGKSNQEALIKAVIARSSFGESPHRSQSSSLVASTIFDLIGSK